MPLHTPQQPPTPAPPQPVTGLEGLPGSLARGVGAAIEQARGALTAELASVMARREATIAELRTLRESDRTGSPGAHIRRVRSLEQLIEQQDRQVLEIERALEAVGCRFTATAATSQPPTPPPVLPPDLPVGQITAVVIVFIVVFFAPISIAVARLIWKRATAPRRPAPAESPRLERLEHAVDSIAVEVERISEGQRYVTRLLTESPKVAALGGRDRDAEKVPQGQAAKGPPGER